MAELRPGRPATAPAIVMLLNNGEDLPKMVPRNWRNPMPRPRFVVPAAALALSMVMATSAQAECYVDYKAKQDNPLRLAYGVSQVSDEACASKKAAASELAPRLAADGWTLMKILSSFGPEGLEERKASAGEFFLRY